MLAVRHARAAALLLLGGVSGGIALSPLPVAAQDGARMDRSIVSPFKGNRRIVVRPGPDGGSEVVTIGAMGAPATVAIPSAVAAPAYAAPPSPAGAFIDIGPLPDPAAPPPAPSLPTEYLDTGPYTGDGLAAPVSSFPPD